MEAFYIYTSEDFLIVPISEIVKLHFSKVGDFSQKYYVVTKRGESHTITKQQFLMLAQYYNAKGLDDALDDFKAKPEPVSLIEEFGE